MQPNIFSGNTKPSVRSKKANHQSALNGAFKSQCLTAAAKILRVNPKTMARKLMFLGAVCRDRLKKESIEYGHIHDIQCDELQTIEHPSTG